MDDIELDKRVNEILKARNQEGYLDIYKEYTEECANAFDALVNLLSQGNRHGNNPTAYAVYESNCADYISKHGGIIRSMLEGAIMVGNATVETLEQ